jgi:hypothetical protein
MRDKNAMPEVVFIGPAKRRMPHKLVIFTVESMDPDGTPRQCTLRRNQELVYNLDDMTFLTAYVPSYMVAEDV